MISVIFEYVFVEGTQGHYSVILAELLNVSLSIFETVLHQKLFLTDSETYSEQLSIGCESYELIQVVSVWVFISIAKGSDFSFCPVLGQDLESVHLHDFKRVEVCQDQVITANLDGLIGATNFILLLILGHFVDSANYVASMLTHIQEILIDINYASHGGSLVRL